MALDDIVKEIGSCQRLAGALRNTEHYDRRQETLDYMKNVLKKDDSALAVYEDGFERMPQTMSTYLNMRESLHQKAAIDATKGEVPKVLEKLAGDDPKKAVLPGLAFELFGMSKDYAFLVQAVKNRDIGTLMHHYQDEKDPIGKSVMQYFEPQTFLRVAQSDLGRMQQEFMQKNFYEEVEKDGEKTLVYKPERAVAYVTENLGKLDPKKQDEMYLQLAIQYAAMASKK